MRMIQYDVKLNRDNGTGYYVSSCNNEEDVRLFSNKGQPIEMKILTHYGDLIPNINALANQRSLEESSKKNSRITWKRYFWEST